MQRRKLCAYRTYRGATCGLLRDPLFEGLRLQIKLRKCKQTKKVQVFVRKYIVQFLFAFSRPVPKYLIYNLILCKNLCFADLFLLLARLCNLIPHKSESPRRPQPTSMIGSFTHVVSTLQKKSLLSELAYLFLI